MKNDMRCEVTYLFLVVVFSACRKNVGMSRRFLKILYVFGSYFRTLVVILVSDFFFSG